MWHSANLMFFCMLGHCYLAATTSATTICTRRKRPGKSASQAVDHLIRFIKVCWKVYNYTFHHLTFLHSLRWSDLLWKVNCCLMCSRLEPVQSNILVTSPKVVSPYFLLRDQQKAAVTPSLLWLTSMDFHVRRQVQWESLMKSLMLIMSLIRHTVLPWPFPEMNHR